MSEARGRFACRAVVFDLDGTLIDSFAGIAASVNHARGQFGLAPLAPADIARHVGWGVDRLIAGCFPPALAGQAPPSYREHYGRTCLETTRLMPAAGETLDRLRARGLLLGVATNKSAAAARQLLDGLGLGARLDALAGAGGELPHKPAPDLLLAALAELDVAPEHALYVGDMHVDVLTARAARVRVIAVATGAETAAELERAGPDRVLASLADLDAIVTPLGGEKKGRSA